MNFTQHVQAWVVSGFFVLLSVPVALFAIVMHLNHYEKPEVVPRLFPLSVFGFGGHYRDWKQIINSVPTCMWEDCSDDEKLLC